MGHILMDGMLALWLDGNINVLGRLLHKSFKVLPHPPALWWRMGRESGSRNIYGREVNFYVPNFLNSIKLS